MATAKHWARYIKHARLAFCPFTSSSSSFDILARLHSRSVVPKGMEVEVKRLRAPDAGAAAPMQRLMLSLVDGSDVELDISTISTDEIIEMIDLENGRIDMEAMRSGKPAR